MDSLYLSRTVGKPLIQCLAQLVENIPSDPIEWIAHWLYRYADSELYFYEKSLFLKEAAKMRLEIEKERERRAQRIQELSGEIDGLKATLNRFKWTQSGSSLGISRDGYSQIWDPRRTRGGRPRKEGYHDDNDGQQTSGRCDEDQCYGPWVPSSRTRLPYTDDKPGPWNQHYFDQAGRRRSTTTSRRSGSGKGTTTTTTPMGYQHEQRAMGYNGPPTMTPHQRALMERGGKRSDQDLPGPMTMGFGRHPVPGPPAGRYQSHEKFHDAIREDDGGMAPVWARGAWTGYNPEEDRDIEDTHASFLNRMKDLKQGNRASPTHHGHHSRSSGKHRESGGGIQERGGFVGPDGKFYEYDENGGYIGPDGKYYLNGKSGFIGPDGKFYATDENGGYIGPDGEYHHPNDGFIGKDGKFYKTDENGGFYGPDGEYHDGKDGFIGPDGKFYPVDADGGYIGADGVYHTADEGFVGTDGKPFGDKKDGRFPGGDYHGPIGTAQWRLDCQLGLICKHSLLGEMRGKPFICPETPEWWERQGFQQESLYDHEIYSRNDDDAYDGWDKIPHMTISDFRKEGPMIPEKHQKPPSPSKKTKK